ncbi:MAG TPA: DUF4258 domain-containing protein [Syntrophaceae bacterium]|nr:DUF4258 domain-containing protein [Syntrophaceae bacterium]
MFERNITTQDINYVLNWGEVKNPRYDNKYDNWEYEVEGSTIDGDQIMVVITLISNFDLLCITVVGK